MNKLGYDDYFVPKPNNISGSAIFWKRDKLACLSKNYQLFGDKSSQFFMFCVLAKKNDAKSINSSIVPSSGTSYQDNRMQFVFGETHLKAKREFQEERIRQTLKITQYFSNNFTDIPVVLGGDFNEEPQNKPICDIMESSFVDLYTLKMIQEKTLKRN